MNLFWATVGNLSGVRHFESVRRFRTLPLNAKAAAGFCECEVDFPGTRVESFSLREIRHDVSLRAFAAPTVLQTSEGLGNGADVQIGGGVRVGDAFQSGVGSKPIANMGRWFCVEISRGAPVASHLNKRDTRPASRRRDGSEARGRG